MHTRCYLSFVIVARLEMEPREFRTGNIQTENGFLRKLLHVRFAAFLIFCRYHKDANETTEWEDILAERGIVPRKKVGSTLCYDLQDIENALDEVLEERKEKVNPYEGRDLGELDDDLDVE